MKYLESVLLPSEEAETEFLLGDRGVLSMTCYDTGCAYPFKIFPSLGLRRIEFEPITIFCGGNGCGKTTLLNVTSELLGLERVSAYNKTPAFGEYVKLASCRPSFGKRAPAGSSIITSDDVFDHLLWMRSENDKISKQREDVFEMRRRLRDSDYSFDSLNSYDELVLRNDANRLSKSKFTSKYLGKIESRGASNGETAFSYFTDRIGENALYLLDEPENSLSPALQLKLRDFLIDSVRFFGCQLVISTHSPFILSIPNAKIYDLDGGKASVKKWTELECVRTYHDFFASHDDEFK